MAHNAYVTKDVCSRLLDESFTKSQTVKVSDIKERLKTLGFFVENITFNGFMSDLKEERKLSFLGKGKDKAFVKL